MKINNLIIFVLILGGNMLAVTSIITACSEAILWKSILYLLFFVFGLFMIVLGGLWAHALNKKEGG